MITIVLADDHPLTRAGIAAFINEEEEKGEKKFELIGQAPNGEKALELITTKKPDIALLDIRMPGLDGISVVRKAKEAKLPTKSIMLTGYVEPSYVKAAFTAGAKGFVCKDSAINVLDDAIRIVKAGGIYIDPSLSGMDTDPSDLETLSPREREVFLLASRGVQVKDVAKELMITERTVQAHLSSVYAKLGGAKNKNAAVYLALANGIITLDEFLNG